MSTYDLEEQEQLAVLKAWWKQYGGNVVFLIMIASVVLAAWSGWNWYQRGQSAKAAVLFEQLQRVSRANDLKAINDGAGILIEDFPRTTYAAMAALVSAKAHFQSGDFKTARAQLDWVVAKARNEELSELARLRLATVMIDDKAVDEAVKLLERKPEAGFEGLYAAVRGDALVAQSKYNEAKVSYKEAIDSKKLDPGMQELVKIKLDALGDS